MAAAPGAPTDMLDPSAAPASGDSEDPSTDDDSQGFTIEIEVDGQGNITVSLEDASQEANEGQGEDAQGTPAKNIADALKIAKEMYLAESGEAGGGSDQAMWDEEAAKRGSPTATGSY